MRGLIASLFALWLPAAASAQTYEASSQMTGEPRSIATFGFAGVEDRVLERDEAPGLSSNLAGSVTFNTSDLYCGWPEVGCAFVIEDPQLGVIVVETPPVPGYLQRGYFPQRHFQRGGELAPRLHFDKRTRRSVPREPRTGRIDGRFRSHEAPQDR